MTRPWYVASITLLLAVGCKARLPVSAVKFNPEVANALRLAELPLAERVDVCSRRIFVFYIGNAEAPGEYYFPDLGARGFPVALQKDLRDKSDEGVAKYYDRIKQQAERLWQAMAKPDPACTTVEVTDAVKAAGKKPGSIFLVTVTDGPEMDDTEILTTHFKYDAQGGFAVDPQHTREAWVLLPGGLDRRAQLGEVHVGRDLERLIRATKEVGDGMGEGRRFNQTIYFLKGHGSPTRTSGEQVDLNDEFKAGVQNIIYDHSAQSYELLFDGHGFEGAEMPTFGLSLWTQAGLCNLYKTRAGEIDGAKAALAPVCNGATPSLPATDTDVQGPIEEAQGIGDEDGPFGDLLPAVEKVSASHFGEVQGIQKGQIWDHDSLLGGISWKTRDEMPGALDRASAAPLGPMGYRLMYPALALGGRTGRLQGPVGIDVPSLLVVDSCFGRINLNAGDGLWGLDIDTSRLDTTGMVSIANPGPLYGDTIDYGALSGAGLAAMTDVLISDWGKKLGRDPEVVKALRAKAPELRASLLKSATPVEGKGTVLGRRLQIGSHFCHPPKQGDDGYPGKWDCDHYEYTDDLDREMFTYRALKVIAAAKAFVGTKRAELYDQFWYEQALMIEQTDERTDNCTDQPTATNDRSCTMTSHLAEAEAAEFVDGLWLLTPQSRYRTTDVDSGALSSEVIYDVTAGPTPAFVFEDKLRQEMRCSYSFDPKVRAMQADLARVRLEWSIERLRTTGEVAATLPRAFAYRQTVFGVSLCPHSLASLLLAASVDEQAPESTLSVNAVVDELKRLETTIFKQGGDGFARTYVLTPRTNADHAAAAPFWRLLGEINAFASSARSDIARDPKPYLTFVQTYLGRAIEASGSNVHEDFAMPAVDDLQAGFIAMKRAYAE